jgi:predicted O-methyltransferase YrrM
MRAMGPWRGNRFALMTALGLGRRGFFIPYRHAHRVPAPGTRPTYAAIETLFAAHEAVFLAMLDRVEDLAGPLEAIGGQGARWDQDWFPRMDAAVAYAMVRAARPRLIVEVGAGHSTRFMARAIADASLETRLVSIDPAPRAAPSGSAVEVIARDLHAVGDEVFAALANGDILFIDSSHILQPGTDVDRLLNHVIPALPAGVLVHLHDIFLPDDYPASWAWRGYNEQLGVAALLNGGTWQPLFASRYVATRQPDWLARGVLSRLPLVPGAYESSLWLRRR